SEPNTSAPRLKAIRIVSPLAVSANHVPATVASGGTSDSGGTSPGAVSGRYDLGVPRGSLAGFVEGEGVIDGLGLGDAEGEAGVGGDVADCDGVANVDDVQPAKSRANAAMPRRM